MVNYIHQLYINPIHESIQSITYTVKPDNETHDQLTVTYNISPKPINCMTNQLKILMEFSGHFKATQSEI